MAPIEKKFIASWGAVMDNDDLPMTQETVEGSIKKVVEYKQEDNKKYKYVRQYRLEKVKTHKNVHLRRQWAKYGAARDDEPVGPNPSNTVVCEDVQMRFILNADDEQLENAREMEQDGLSKLASSNANVVKCRLCEMDHWTSKCPYKVHYEQKNELGGVGVGVGAGVGGSIDATSGKYVPPSRRDGVPGRPGDMMGMTKREDFTVRVTNLPEEITDSDIKDLFKNIGEVSRIYLARDKITAKSKGYAFVSFRTKTDAAKAIKIVNGFGYANLILTVEWAKPSTNN